MFNPRSTRSPTPAGLPLGYFCMNVQSALHAEPDAPVEQVSNNIPECSIRAPRGARPRMDSLGEGYGLECSIRAPRGARHSYYDIAIEGQPCSIRAPRGARQQKQPIACLSLLLYYSIFYRILQASDTYKTPVTAKKLKIRCEIPDDFVFARVSHL